MARQGRTRHPTTAARAAGVAVAALLAALAAPVAAAPADDDLRAGDGVSAAAEGHYIVRFRDGAGPGMSTLAAADGIEVDRVFDHVFDGMAARLDDRALARLQRDPDVVQIRADRQLSLDPVAATAAGTVPQADPASWGLDRIDQRTLPLDQAYDPHVAGDGDGDGVTVYVVDSGIWPDHAEFTDRIFDGYDGVADGNSTDDCHGHGTHVAGTVAGTEHGVAKAAKLRPVRVLDCNGNGLTSQLLHGFDYILGEHTPGEPGVVNVSLGGPVDDEVDDGVQELVDAGLVVVVAAGNEGRDACLGSPARSTAAITVAASDELDRAPSFSNRGPCIDLFAPGVAVTSAGLAGTNAVRDDHGTSMAAPHVAGAAALLLSETPDATPADIAARLTADATVGAVANTAIADPGIGNTHISPNRLLHLGDPGDPSPTPPANDDVAAAHPLTLPQAGPTFASNVYADTEPGEPRHAGVAGGRSVWFRFTAPTDGTVTLSTAGSKIDTVMALYTGTSIGTLNTVATDDDGGGADLSSRIEQFVPGSWTYSLAVDGFAAAMGAIEVEVDWEPGAGPCTATPTFRDVPNAHPFCPDIGWLAATGITTGYLDDTFRPGAEMTRQASAAFLHRYAAPSGFTPPTTPTFTDVPPGHPFFREIEWLASRGITSGFPDGTFRPSIEASRQATAAFLHRFVAAENASTPTDFADVPDDHHFAPAIAWLASTGITSGYDDGTFRPAADVTRQAIAVFLHRLDDDTA